MAVREWPCVPWFLYPVLNGTSKRSIVNCPRWPLHHKTLKFCCLTHDWSTAALTTARTLSEGQYYVRNCSVHKYFLPLIVLSPFVSFSKRFSNLKWHKSSKSPVKFLVACVTRIVPEEISISVTLTAVDPKGRNTAKSRGVSERIVLPWRYICRSGPHSKCY